MATNDSQEDENFCEHNECRKTVFVRSVPHSLRRKELTEFFSRFGPLSKVSIHTNCKTRKSKGTAQVQFLKLEDAENVLKLSENELKCRDRILKPIPNRCQRVWKYKASKDEIKPSSCGVNESECYINTLPTELLNYIFSLLQFKERIRVEKVCKLWHHLSSSIPWANMYCLKLEDSDFPGRKKLNSSVLENILRRCGSTLKSLDLSLCDHQSLSLKFPIIIANHCPNLEVINLHGREISWKAIGVLAESCQKLKNVDLSKSSAGDKWISKLLRHCNIEKLSLSHQNKITGKNFQLFRDCIKELNINYCTNLFPGALDLIAKRKSIENLYLHGLSATPKNSIELMFRSLGSSLKVLDLGGFFQHLSSSVMSEGLSHCRNLEELLLEGNNFVDNTVVEAVCKKCLGIRTIDLSGCYIDDESLTSLGKLENLQNLMLNYNDRITNTGLSEVTSKGTLLTLELRACESISDEAFETLFKNCRELELLDVSSCPAVTENAFIHVLSPDWISNAAKKLKIFAGGTDMTAYPDLPTVEISEVNKCPRERRPWNMDYYYEADDDDDEDWDDALDFDDDYDYDYDYDDVEGWGEDVWDVGYVEYDPMGVLYVDDMDDWN